MNFDEAQKLTWKEMKFVWFNKNNNLKSLPELLKMQVESKAEMFISTHVVTTQKGTRGSHIVKPRICVRLQLV